MKADGGYSSVRPHLSAAKGPKGMSRRIFCEIMPPVGSLRTDIGFAAFSGNIRFNIQDRGAVVHVQSLDVDATLVDGDYLDN